MGDGIYAEFRTRSLERRKDVAILQVEGKKHSSVTYGKMLDEIEAVSVYLSTLGLSEGQTVAILSENRYEWMVCYFAVVSLGLIAVPLDPQSQAPDLGRALKHADVQVVFSSESFKGSIEALQKEIPLKRIVFFGDAYSEIVKKYEKGYAAARPMPSAGRVASVIYTSGTTGTPKGVALTHGNLLSNALVISTRSETAGKIRASILPVHHVYGFTLLFASLLRGVATIFYPKPDPETLFFSFESLRPHFVSSVPAVIEKFAGAIRKRMASEMPRWLWWLIEKLKRGRLGGSAYSFRSVKKAVFRKVHRKFGGNVEYFNSGGAALDPDLARFFNLLGLPVLNGYGLTETSPVIAGTDPFDGSYRLGSVGKPLGDTQIRIAFPDAEGIGEICVKGSNVMAGYYKNDEETRKVFDAEGWFRTGDLGKIHNGGFLSIAGRSKDLIVTPNGKNVYPAELERHFAKIPWIKELCIFGVNRRNVRRSQDEVVHIQIVPDLEAAKAEGVTDVFAEIRKEIEALAKILPAYQSPRSIGFSEKPFPRSASLKIQKYKVKEQWIEGQKKRFEVEKKEAAIDPAFSTPMGAIVRKVLKELVSEDFSLSTSLLFDLGIDSLTAMEVADRLQDETGVEVPPETLLQGATVDQLLKILEGNTAHIASTAEDYRRHCQPEKTDFSVLPLQESFLIDREMGGRGCWAFLDMDLEGELDPVLFERSLWLLTRRHPTLRLVFKKEAAGFSQKSDPEGKTFSYRFEDLRPLSEVERSEIVRTEMEKLASHRFQHFSGDTFRAVLLQTESMKFRLLINFDHLVVDGLSLVKLLRDLQKIYENPSEEMWTEPQPGQNIGFKEYVEISKALRDSSHLEKTQEHWLKKFPAYEPFPELPCAEGFAGKKEDGFDTLYSGVPVSVVKKLQSVAKAQGITLYALLLACFFKLIAQWSSSERITINVPHLHRKHYSKDVNDIVGCFTDILPIRAETALNGSLIEIARTIHHDLAEMMTHGDISGVELARAIAEKNRVDPQALSPVIFSSAFFHGASFGSTNSFKIAAVRPRTGAPATWLDVVVLLDEKDSLVCSWNFSKARFSERWMNTFASQYASILEIASENPESVLPLDSLLSPGEEDRLAAFNQTVRDYGDPQTLHARIEKIAEKFPSATAVTSSRGSLTYRDLNLQANYLAHGILGLGVAPKSLIPIISHRTPDFVVGLLGILKSGCAYVPVDPNYPRERQEYVLKDSGASVVLISRKCLEESHSWLSQLTQIRTFLCLDDDLSGGWAEGLALPPKVLSVASLKKDMNGRNPQPSDVDSPAYVIYTSGSTGKPKGVMIPHRGIDNRLRWMQEQFPISPSDAVAQKTTQSFDVSVWEFFWPLQEGSRLVLIDDDTVRDPKALLRTLQKQRITVMHFVPSLLAVFLSDAEKLSPTERELPALRWVVTSGEALPLESVRRWKKLYRTPLANLYGPTEASVDVTYWVCENVNDRTTVPIGKPIANTQIHILNPELKNVPIGVAGEIYIGGVGLAAEYVNQPALTAERFVHVPLKGGTERLYKTGDLGRWAPDGNVEFLGRIDHQVKIRGFRIELGEIESVLSGHPSLRDVVVHAREDRPGEKRLVAYVVRKVQAEIEAAELRGFLKAKLPEYMVPSFFVFLDELPLSANGKVDRKRLPSPEILEPREKPEYEAPRTDVERKVAEIWSRLSGLERTGIHESFFDVGGHSLMAMQFISLVDDEYRVELSVRSLMEKPTIAGVAGQVEACLRGAVGETAQTQFLKAPKSGKPIHSWLKHMKVAFLPGPATPLLKNVKEKLLHRFQDLGHELQQMPHENSNIVLTTARFGEPLEIVNSLLFTGPQMFHLTRKTAVYTLVHISSEEFLSLIRRFKASLKNEIPNPKDYEFAGLAPEAYKELHSQGRRGGPLMVLERLIQAQTKCHRIVLFVGDENPMVAYHFDLVGSFPYTEGKDLDEFYEDVVLRMVTTASTRELKDHEVEKTVVSSSVWEGLPTPAAMCDASRELGKRGFFTEPAHLERYVEIPDFFPLDSMMSRQYSEGCFGAWDVKLEALIATVTGSAVPVHKGNISEEDLAIISGIKEDRSGAVIRHRQGVPNHPPSVEAVELMMMDRTLPQVIPPETSSSKAPVVRAKLHGHRGIASYDPRYVEFVPVDGPYYDYIVTCATEAQAWAVEGAFAKSEALRNPDDPRKVVFTILPGHGNVIVEKWASGTRPFQTILDYMDKGYVTVESYVPQGRVEYLSAADGKKIVHIVEEDPETIVNRYRDPSRKAQVS